MATAYLRLILAPILGVSLAGSPAPVSRWSLLVFLTVASISLLLSLALWSFQACVLCPGIQRITQSRPFLPPTIIATLSWPDPWKRAELQAIRAKDRLAGQ